MIKGMTRQIEGGSKWYIISLKWLMAWQKYVYFDLLQKTEEAETPASERVHPGKINNADIIAELPKNQYMLEIASAKLW